MSQRKKKEEEKEERVNKMWFVTESNVFASVCVCAVQALTTGSKVYFRTAWDKRQCKIRLCLNDEALFAYNIMYTEHCVHA